MKTMLFLLATYVLPSFLQPTFTPPKWEGHWEAYSESVPDQVIGKLDITRVQGKEYSWKLWVKNDIIRPGVDAPCPEMEYEGTATYNGVYGLNSTLKGIGFAYEEETGTIGLFHDYTDATLIDMSLCFDPGPFRRINQ